MAGWSYTGGVYTIGSRGAPDDGEKVTAFPALAAGNVGWWQDWAWKLGQDFTRECKRLQTNVATVKVSANNDTGDTKGVGTLTITIVTT